MSDLRRRATAALARQAERARDRLRRTGARLEEFRWDRQVAERRQRVAGQAQRLHDLMAARVHRGRAALGRAAGKLETLSPLSVLSRGYALVWDGEGRLLRSAAEAAPGDPLRIRLEKGHLIATVTSREEAP